MVDESPPLLPNPDTYLNHLSPAEATQFEVARNVYLFVLGATIWDILVYIPEDMGILGGNIGLLRLCFVFARALAMTYIIVSVIVQNNISVAYTIPYCEPLEVAMGIITLLLTACTSFPFLLRVQTIYTGNRLAQRLFFCLWFVNSGLGVVVPIGTHARHIHDTGYCTTYEVESYISLSKFSSIVFDTVIFVATSYKIASTYNILNTGVTWDTVVFGKGLPRLSRAVLRSGQQYYIVILGANILTGVLLNTPSVPPIYRRMLGVPSAALNVSMTCRIFRYVRIHGYDSPRTPLPVLSDFSPSSEDTTPYTPTEIRSQIYPSTITSRGPARVKAGTNAEEVPRLGSKLERSSSIAEVCRTESSQPSFEP